MLRKMVITLAAAAALTAGSMIPASAHGMGGGHGGGGGMMYGHGGGGFAHYGHSGGFVGHGGGFHHDFDGRFAFRHHHRFFFNSFAFYGGYPYDNGCYRRVWTRWGWRLVSVCY